MKHLEKAKPGGRGLAYVLPDGPWYYPMVASVLPHHDEFLGTAIDTDEWADASTLATGGGSVAFAASFVTLDSGTGTASTATLRLRSAMTANANIYTVPFRAMFAARISTTAGAGIAPADTDAGSLAVYLGVRSTDETHIAQFHFDLTTAGSSSLAAPIVIAEVRSGSTGAGFIASAAHSPFSTTNVELVRTATSVMGYVIEVTHNGTWFGLKDDMSSPEPPRELSFFANPVLRIDKNYFLDARMVSIGTAGGNGFTQTAGVQLELDSVTVEQFAYQAMPGIQGEERKQGAVHTLFLATPPASASVALVTSGMGVFLGFQTTSTATATTNTFAAFYDASAASSGCYDYVDAHSGSAKLLWLQQIGYVATTGVAVMPGTGFPAGGIPFFRGLVAAETDAEANAVGGSTLNIIVSYRNVR